MPSESFQSEGETQALPSGASSKEGGSTRSWVLGALGVMQEAGLNLHDHSLVGPLPLAVGTWPAGPWRAGGALGMWSGFGGNARGGGVGRFSLLPPSPTIPSACADEPTSPSIDLQAKHVPASAVVSSAMNSAPVLGTSPSSPTFTFALGRHHYSQDCSECSPQPQPHLLPCCPIPSGLPGPAA